MIQKITVVVKGCPDCPYCDDDYIQEIPMYCSVVPEGAENNRIPIDWKTRRPDCPMIGEQVEKVTVWPV